MRYPSDLPDDEWRLVEPFIHLRSMAVAAAMASPNSTQMARRG
jgi:hypothetical protein